MSDVDNVNCMMCLAHIVDGAPHEGHVYIEHGVVHATAFAQFDGSRWRRALVCTLAHYRDRDGIGWSAYHVRNGPRVRWVAYE